jgi:hypothetical protein
MTRENAAQMVRINLYTNDLHSLDASATMAVARCVAIPTTDLGFPSDFKATFAIQQLWQK